ncbi:MAG: DUF2847 family protein [Ekhidna sp.]|nr:DUF2847 family protein [Ekhidna sp.]MBC6410089.1 DUF2847 family protein [Ekhidna sp.]
MSDMLIWKDLQSLEDLNRMIENSKSKPALVFKYGSSSTESIASKARIESEWNISSDQLNCYIADAMLNKDVATEVSETVGVPDVYPQISLFADGVTMYDESYEMISVKKIRLVHKIINRTFRWMETRV